VQESSESKKRLNRRPDQGRQPNSRHSLAPPANFGSKVASVPLLSNNYHYQTSAGQRQKQEAEADLIRADRALPLLHRKDSYHPLSLARPRARAISQHPDPHYPSSYPTLPSLPSSHLTLIALCSSQSFSSTTHLGLSQPSRVCFYLFCF
jgi:hypothetical protein